MLIAKAKSGSKMKNSRARVRVFAEFLRKHLKKARSARKGGHKINTLLG